MLLYIHRYKWLEGALGPPESDMCQDDLAVKGTSTSSIESGDLNGNAIFGDQHKPSSTKYMQSIRSHLWHFSTLRPLIQIFSIES